MPELSKRFELRLPLNHSIWSYPAGERTRVARDWLDLGSRIAALEDAVQRIAERLETNTAAGLTPGSSRSSSAEQLNIDKDKFLDAFGK